MTLDSSEFGLKGVPLRQNKKETNVMQIALPLFFTLANCKYSASD